MKIKAFTAISLIAAAIFVCSISSGWMDKPARIDNAIIQQSVSKGLLLLQTSGYVFTNNTRFKCASCHHTTLTSMAADIARNKGVPLVDSFTANRIYAMEGTIREICNPNLINQFVPVNFIAPYILIGLAAEKYPANMYTDISVNYIMSQAKPDGSFLAESVRVPLETGEIHITALAIRAVELYASPAKKTSVSGLIIKTKNWLEKAQTNNQQELVFQLLGMQWCGSDVTKKTTIAVKLKGMQNTDGGWAQLPTLKSDAYATGQALYALYESGMVKPADALYQQGISYLLKTQQQTGAWFVATRSFPIQPFVDSDFPPYDNNQHISAAASNWAVMALLIALPDKS